METPDARSVRRRLTDALVRLLAIADHPEDDDETRRRKRVGVGAGYLTIVAPLTLPIQAGGAPLAFVLAFGLSVYSVLNLWLLARTGEFQRYVTMLISSGLVIVPAGTFLGGGITGSSSGIVWGFLIPAYAMLALGPHRATRWLFIYLAMVALIAVVDPWIRQATARPPYELQLFGQLQNIVTPLVIAFLLLRYTDVRRLAAEARVDELLTNAIPRSIAARLRRGERRIAESYPATSIVFSDIVGFTTWAQRTSPDRVVAMLDDLFTRLDDIAAQHGLEKIKTIGDSYMAVAGAPEPRDDHAVAAIEFARAMIDVVAEKRRAESDADLEVRIGIASGPVVGGVIGRQRLLFDLWGDTVNLASRMESSGVPGRIHVAASTRDLLADRYDFERREVDVKGFGRLTTYLVR
jgi:guanylate cyclase